MKTKNLMLLAFLAAALLLIPAALNAADPSKEEVALSAKLILALEKSDYAAFIADGDAPFRQLKKEQFDGIAAKLSPLLQPKHEVTYLGDMRRQGYHVTLWRVRFEAGSNDLLATLSVKDGKVGGIFLN